MSAIRIVIASALITAAAIKAVPALAEPSAGQDVSVSVVRTADLDLASSSGQRQLDQRISFAAREVCGAASDSDLEGKNDVRTCRKNVRAIARAKAGALIAGAGNDREIVVAAQH
jgi:UrcA family protein